MRPAHRLGTLSDVRALVRMHAQCSPLTVERSYLSPVPVLAHHVALRLLTPSGGFSLLVEREKGLAAIGTVAPVDESWARLSQLVLDRYQHQGIGTALFLGCAHEARRRGLRQLVLTAHTDNEAVLRMVHAAGLRARVTSRDGLADIAVTLPTS